MTDFLFGLHSGLRYLVLLAAVATMIAAALGWQRGGSGVRAERPLMTAFVGLVDAQVLAGVLLLLTWPFHGALIGHITLMVLAAAAAHAGSVIARRRSPERSASPVRVATTALVLVLIIGGIMAIQRPIL